MIIYLLAIGLVSILAQVVLLRELAVAFYGVELIYILAIGAWLLWTALGALAGRRRRPRSTAAIAALFVSFAFLLPADVVFIRVLRSLAGGVPGTYLPFGVQIAGLLAALLPPGIALGYLFQSAAKIAMERGRTLAAAYAVESVGGVLGGFASTAFLAFGVQNFMIAVICGALALAAVLAGERGNARRAAAAALFFVLVFAFAAPRIDVALTRASHPALVATRDSPYGRITVARHGAQSVVFENDVLAFETQSVGAEEFVHIAAAHADTLRRVLVLGGGVEGLVPELLKYSPDRLDYVELNPVLVSLAETHIPGLREDALGARPVELVIDDPRRFVERARSASSRYDLILVGMPDPTSGQSNRFYTREFFELCADILEPDGVLALRLRSSENIWTPFLFYRNASIVKALSAAFADAVVLPGTTNVIIASGSPLPRDPAESGRRLERRDVETRLVTPAYIAYLYTNDRFHEIARMLSAVDAPANTDARPVSFTYSSMIWLSRFFPPLIAAEMRPASSRRSVAAGAAAAVALLSAAFLLIRRRSKPRLVLLAFLAGFIGMVLETQLILFYQVKSGVLYQNLGVLLMAFMAGLAAGAGALDSLFRKNFFVRHEMLWGRGMFAAFGLLNLLLVGLLRLDTGAGLFTMCGFLFTGGALVSGVFAYASRPGEGDPRVLVSPLYAADLLGGVAGSVLAALVLAPFLGMGLTAWAMTILSLAALLAL